ncbi:uncharacterized protein [Solanum lycopersicum]|uniref:uncharacterized protein n=1 Tax=Solanum lycopersicum TaxID=4081 RepID=UPI0037496BB8
MGSLTDVQPERRDMVREIQRLSSFGVRVANSEDSGVSIREVAESLIIDEMAPYEALYGRKCRSPIGWFDVCETNLIGSDVIQQAVDKVKLIQERLLVSQSRQKSYADNQRRDLKFQIDDWVFLKVAYELDLPSDLEAVHPVFRVSMLYKCVGDPSRVFPVDDIQVTEEFSYEEKPVAILDRQVDRYNF